MTSRGTKYWTSGAIPLVAPDLLGDIIASASDLAIVVTDLGRILSVMVNAEHPGFGALGTWDGRDIRETLASESVPKIEARLAAIARGEAPSAAVELNHREAPHLSFPVRYTFHTIGPDGAVLMLGRDLRPIAEMQQRLMDAQLALERDYEDRREVATRMRVLLETTQEAVLFVALGSGRIVDANAQAAHLVGRKTDALAGVHLDALAPPAAPVLADLARHAEEHVPGAAELRLSGRTLFAQATLFRAAGERMLLLRLREAEAGAARTDREAAALGQLFENGADAIVLTDHQGELLGANDAFLALVDAAQLSDVRGRQIGDFLARGGVDQKVLRDNVMRSGRMRLYATRLTSAFGGRPVEIAAARIDEPAWPGIAYVIRDASRLDALRDVSGDGPAGDGAASARTLVGKASLREIVAETTDVIERMCIETAVDLTGNNRVAAAEMLGLSRQSLYVKLRKYDLLARDD